MQQRKPVYVLASDLATRQVRLIVMDQTTGRTKKFNSTREAAHERSKRRLFNFNILATN